MRRWGMLLVLGIVVLTAALLAAATQTRVARVCAAAGCLVVAGSVGAQAPEPAVYLRPAVRAQLRAAWDATNPRQHERGYCLGVEEILSPAGELVYLVSVATRAVAIDDGPAHVVFECGSRPTLHIHTPTTCPMLPTPRGPAYAYDACEVGGPGKDVTWPSPSDQRNLDRRGAPPFGLIQFAPDGFTAFYPRRLTPPDASAVR